MKKIVFSITILILVITVYSCSKDHDAPTFSQYSSLKKATNVVASYDADIDSFIITWDMDSAAQSDIVDYYIVISDSSDFKGDVFSVPNLSTETRHSISSSFILSNIDTAIYYFAIKAVYDNDYFDSFQGQLSEADSALFLRQ